MGSTNPTVASVKAVAWRSGAHRSGAGSGLSMGMPAAAMSHLVAPAPVCGEPLSTMAPVSSLGSDVTP